MKIILGVCAFLLAPFLLAQTVTTQPQTVTTSAPKVPAQTITITTQRNGGKVSFTIPAQTLAQLSATVPGQTAPVSLSGFTGILTCSLPLTIVPTVKLDAAGNPAGTVYVLAYNGTSPPIPDASGNMSVSGMVCTVQP